MAVAIECICGCRLWGWFADPEQLRDDVDGIKPEAEGLAWIAGGVAFFDVCLLGGVAAAGDAVYAVDLAHSDKCGLIWFSESGGWVVVVARFETMVVGEEDVSCRCVAGAF